MRVAMRMYCEIGRDVSMARICEESGIAKGTIFRYFPTRDELFRQAFDACRNRALAMAGKGVGGELGGEKTLKKLVRQSFEWPLRFPDEFRFVVMYTDASAFFAMDEDEPGSVLFDALGETRFSELASQRLRPDIVVERFASQSPADMLIAPKWGLKNHEFTNLVVNRMKKKGTWQGRLAGAEDTSESE